LTRSPRALPLAVALLGLLILLAVTLGAEPLSLFDAVSGRGLARTILLEVRLPRVALAALAGGGLAVVGGAYQALLRNPLAEPYILGVSGGAALAATTTIALGLSAATALGAALIPAASFIGGLLATALVYSVARGLRDGAEGTSILLAGVMVNSIAAALITFLKVLVSPSRAQQILRWLVGFVDLPYRPGLVAAAIYVGLGCAVLLHDAGRLNLLALGDETAATVSLTGLIGFVGLVVPHAVRRYLGPDHRRVLPMSVICGASMLIGCDLAARLAFRSLGTEPPVGAVTALIGGPAFLMMLRKQRSWR
jgi:iron complex transport system permease protein